MENDTEKLAAIKRYLQDVKKDCLKLQRSGDLTEAGCGQLEIIEELEKIIIG